jgi:hypothetical protein
LSDAVALPVVFAFACDLAFVVAVAVAFDVDLL